MKRLLFLLMTILMILPAISQIRKIPSEVTNAFTTKYPDAKNVQWKDNLSNFSARYTSKDSTKCEASFNGKGEWLSTEEELDKAKLPAEVKEGLAKSKYADREVTEALKIEKKDAELRYRLLSKKSGVEKKYLYFDKTGKLVKEAMTL